MRTLVGMAAALALVGTVMAVETRPDGRKLVWSDEFEGDALDLTKWRFRRTMNSTDCTYTNDSRTARVENGCLRLRVVPSGDPAKPQMLPRGVATHDTMGFRYGYLEMRAKVPFRHGAWPSFWMTSTGRLKTCPYTAETDIFEVFASSNSVVANLHKWGWDAKAGKSVHTMLPYGEGSATRAYTFPDAAKLNEEFHVYGMEWNPKEMAFFVDGRRFLTCPIDEAHDFSARELPGMSGFHDFQSVIFNNEIFTPGHGWCPERFRIVPGDELPIEYDIDWVRLWQKPGEEICCRMEAAPSGLTVERVTEPDGIDAATPRLGWRLPEGVKAQTAYEIVADGWSSGKVESSASVDVPWGGRKLRTSDRVGWKVRVWDECGRVSPWSERRTFVMGVMDAADWKARWIGPDPKTAPEVDFGGAKWLAGDTFAGAFEYDGRGACDFVLASTEAYHVYLNGREFFGCAGHFYDYRHIRIFDLARSLKAGRNELKVVLRGGGDAKSMEHRGAPGARAILGVVRRDGRPFAGTGEAWGGKALGGAKEPPFAAAIDFTEELASPAFVKRFAVSNAVRRATLHVTGLGFYEAYLNGVKVGRKVLDPAPTDYDDRVLYSTYVLDGQVKAGANELKLVVGHGWYDMRSVATWNFDHSPWRTRPKAIAQLELEGADGKRTLVVTDGSWEQVDSPVIYDCVREGEVTGARGAGLMKVAPGTKARLVAPPKGRLVAETLPAARVVEEFAPTQVRNLANGRAVVTFPKEVSGWARLTVRGLAAGDEVAIRYDENLKPDGSVTDEYVPGPWRMLNDNDRAVDRYFLKTRSAGFVRGASGAQYDHFVSAGLPEERHEARFVWHGFRHLVIDGLKTPLKPDDVRAVWVRTGFAETGAFACSDPVLNRLVEHARQSYRCNFACGYPTDCPHREKLGWTGDGWIASELGFGYFDVAAAYEKWLDDILDTQLETGAICSIAPTCGWGFNRFAGPVFDAALGMLPWNLWRLCGDRRAIDRAYEPLKRYLANKRGEESEPGLMKGGLGDWNASNRNHMPADEYVISCHYLRLQEVAAEMARIEGRPEEAKAFAAGAARTRGAIRRKYGKGGGAYDNGRQTAQALAIMFGLVEGGEELAAAVRRLVAACEETGCHVDFGLVGAKWVYRALSKVGRSDVAYRMITNPTAPSMVGWLDRTGCLWEDFDNGFSKCHVMLGDFAAWCQQELVGITALEPGYRRVRVAPRPIDALDWAQATVGTPYGPITARWERKDGKVRVTVDAPAGVEVERIEE